VATRAEKLWWAAAVMVSGLALLWRLGAYPLVQPDEGRNAEVAREMEASGSWLIPTLNGIPYLDKPALYFKLVGVSMDLLGNSEWAARLPSALFGLATLGLLFAFCKRHYTTARAATTVIVVATSPLYIMYSRLVIFDMALTFFTTAAVLAGYCAETLPELSGAARRRWHCAGAIAAGLGTLVKGPVGFLTPALVLITLFLLERRRDALRRLFAPLNLLIFSAIVLPWFVGVSYRFPEFPFYGVVEESILRYTTDKFNRNQPLYFYPAVLVAGFFPWSVLLLDPLSRAWRAYARLENLERLCLVWIAVTLVFFSLSHSKLPGYLLGVAAPVALLVSRCFDSTPDERTVRASPAVLRHTSLALGIFCAGSAAALALLMLLPGLHRQAPQLDSVLVEEIGRRWIPIVGALVLLTVLATGASRTRRTGVALAAFTALPLLSVTAGFGPWMKVAERRSARSLAATVDSRAGGAEIVCVRCFPTSLPFYLGRTITVVSEIGNELSSNYIPFALERGEARPPDLIRGSEFHARVASRSQPLYLLSDDSLAQDSGRPELEAIARAYDARVEPLVPGYLGALIPLGTAR
jgi:4-amino-4-deoxy-L-arabinose transferase-like glycosyltransferase